MYVEIAAFACAACLYALGAVLWLASRQIPLAAPLRDAAIAEFVVATGLLLRVWAPDSVYGPIAVLAATAYGGHAAWILTALRRLRGWDARTGTTAAALGMVAVSSGAGLVWPSIAYAMLGLAYLVMAALYVACLWPASSQVPDAMRLPLRLIGGCGLACALMYVGWGSLMIVAPERVLSHGSGPPLAASFLFGLWLNLVATSGYLLLVLRRLMAEIEGNALLDPLTGACNRRGLVRHIERARAQGCGLIAIDLDHFKQVNDGYGHSAGDHVLAACAARLRGELRDDDVLVRMGGEEFLAVIGRSEAANLDRVAERLREAVAAQPVRLPDGMPVTVTISLGTAESVCEGAARFESDLARADRALYEAKRSGRNRVVSAETLERFAKVAS